MTWRNPTVKCILPLASLLAACLASTAVADVTLPAVFSDHMVLQRDMPLAVWGSADAGEKVTVSIAGQTAQAAADADGKWSVKLTPLAPGGPHQLVVSGNNTVRVGDVLVGEVWLCSGQSNMAMAVRGVMNAEQEIAAGTALGTFSVVLLGYQRLFNHDHQFLVRRIVRRRAH